MKIYDWIERGENWTIIALADYEGIEVWVGERGICIDAVVDSMNASGSGKLISWSVLEEARQRAIAAAEEAN